MLQRAHRRNLVLAAAALLLVTATAWPAVASATTIPAGNDPVAIAVNSVTNKIYVANFSSNDVTVIDGATNSATTVGVGQAPIAIAVNSVTNKIYVANSGSAGVTVIDGATNSTATVAVGASPNDVAVNSVTNKIYVANSYSATVTVIDGMTNSATTVAVHGHPSSLAVNPQTNEVYVTCPNWGAGSSDPWGSYVDVLDGSTNAVTSVSVGYDCSGIAVNAITNRVYVPCIVARSGYGYATMYVIDGATKAVTAAFAAGIAPNWPYPVAINSVTNKIYMPDGRGDVSVIDGATNAVNLVAGCVSGPSPVAVNTATNRTYIGNGSGVTVLDGASSSVTTVATGSQANAVAVNSVTNKIYVANASNDVTVIDGDMKSPDPVPTVNGNSTTKKPVLVMIAGLDSDTGLHLVQKADGTWVSNNFDAQTGDWRGFFVPAAPPDRPHSSADLLGASKVLVMPTAPNASRWPSAARDPAQGGHYCIDSTGYLQDNMSQLANWLEDEAANNAFDGHPIILIGHSYGGVIARSMLASDVLPYGSAVRHDIAGIIQLGSPNGGSPLAALKVLLDGIPSLLGQKTVGFYLDLNQGAMTRWNEQHSSSVEVPVVRFGGTYLPWALDVYDLSPDCDEWKSLLMQAQCARFGDNDNDYWVAYDSLKTGYGSLKDQKADFGDGACTPDSGLAHSWDSPMAGQTYSWQPGLFQAPITLNFGGLIPRDYSDTLFWPIAQAIRTISAHQAALAPVQNGRARATSAAADATSPVDATPSFELPEHTVHVAADSSAQLILPLDAPAIIQVASLAGSPSVTVRDAAGTQIAHASNSEVGTDGAYTTALTVTPVAAGAFTFDFTLPGGTSGDVTLSGVARGGARLSLSASDSAWAGVATSVTAQFETASGDPLTGAVVHGEATLNGEQDVALTYRDDGTGGDSSAADGIYTATPTLPAPGSWVVKVQAVHPAAERLGLTILDVGDALATVSGPITAATPAGPDGTLTAFGVRVPVSVSQDGTYTLSGVLTDSSGERVGVVTTTANLEASDSTTLEATIDAARLAGIADGPLTVSPLRITREVDGRPLLAGVGPGLTTDASYAATDFYNFSVSLSGPAANPSPTHQLHFTGTALNTASTVASVEYTIDGGATWHAATPTDGAFDSHAEAFTIDLDLPDYVYGILVRQTGADGTQLPVADWAGIRFTVDTVAPAQVADLAALVTSESGSPVARASWLPSGPAIGHGLHGALRRRPR